MTAVRTNCHSSHTHRLSMMSSRPGSSRSQHGSRSMSGPYPFQCLACLSVSMDCFSKAVKCMSYMYGGGGGGGYAPVRL